MKKFKVIVLLLAFVVTVSGCTVNADSNLNVTYPVYDETISDADEVPPYGYEIETRIESLDEPVVEVRHDYETVSGGASWIYNKVQDGTAGYRSIDYIKTYNINNELLSTMEVIDSEVLNETTNTIIANGQRAASGAYFETNRITRYGVDCSGCNMGADNRGGTSAGIGLGKNEVRQQDGTWSEGITYEGYYIIASDASLPLCTIVEISDHDISGSGITPGVPFKAIVLDRGGAIKGTKLDLFTGSESAPQTTHMPNGSAKVTIISVNSRYKSNGLWNCDI